MTDQTTQATVPATHSKFLNILSTLTDALGPILSALVPGAAPVVLAAHQVESIAGNVLTAIDSVKSAAADVQNNPAPVPEATVNSVITTSPPPAPEPLPVAASPTVSAPVVTNVEVPNPTDAATIAANSIALPTDPEALSQRVLKLEGDVAVVMDDWAKVQAIFKQMGL